MARRFDGDRILIRNTRAHGDRDLSASDIRVHATTCYDVLISLRALSNPRTYEATRSWTASAKQRLSAEALSLCKFFFSGRDTSLGYGITPLIAELDERATPDDLVDSIRETDAAHLALLMLDTGELTTQAREAFGAVLADGWDEATVTTALEGASPSWARTCRRVLRDPDRAKADLLTLLEEYIRVVFVEELDHIAKAVEQGARRADELLTVLPATAAIEQLTGGYTIDGELELREVVLAPSTFIHPYVTTRLDERKQRAIIVFGLHSEPLSRFDRVPIDNDLQAAVKALGDPARLRLLRLVAAGAQTSGELQEQVGLAPATVHHHLHQLRAAGFIRQKRTKAGMSYTVRRDSARDLLERLSALVLGPDELSDFRSEPSERGTNVLTPTEDD